MKIDLAEELRPGPASAADLGRWPVEIAESLTATGLPNDTEGMSRIEAWLRRGIVVYTDYSGVDCPKEAMELGLAGLQHVHGWDFSSERHPPLRFARACDCDPLPQQILLSLAGADSPGGATSCVFSDIADRLPPVGHAWVEAATPPEDACLVDKVAAHADIATWLRANSGWLFDSSCTSHCLAHGRRCPAHPLFGSDGGIVGASEGPSKRPLMLNVAGVSCLPWCQPGAGEGEGSKCDIAHSIWLEERRARALQQVEDMFLLECTPRYPADRLQERLQETHEIRWLTTGPELFGWPHKRRRLLAVGYNKATMAWAGACSMSSMQQEFAQRFHRSIMASGDMLMMASPAEMCEEYSKLAKVQKNRLEPSCIAQVPKQDLLRLLLPAGAVHRLSEWRAEMDRLKSVGGVALVDIDHHPGTKGTTGGSDWPVSLRHGTIVCLKQDDPEGWRIGLALEHFTALGFFMYAPMCESFPTSRLKFLLSHLSVAQQKSLAGNGMHLVTQTAWTYFCLANLAPMAPIPHIPVDLDDAPMAESGSECDLPSSQLSVT